MPLWNDTYRDLEIPQPSYAAQEQLPPRLFKRIIQHVKVYRLDLLGWVFRKLMNKSEGYVPKRRLFPFKAIDQKLQKHGASHYGSSNANALTELTVITPRFSFYKGEKATFEIEDVTVREVEIQFDTDDQIYKQLKKELSESSGWVAVIPPGDSLAPWIGYELVNVNTSVCYFDSTLEVNGNHEKPSFHADFSKVNLWSGNHIGDVLFMKPEAVGLLPEHISEVYAYEFWLTCADREHEVEHVALLGVHNNKHRSNTEKEAKVLERRLKAHGKSFVPNTEKVLRFECADELISIIIPTRNGVNVLRPCVESILRRSEFHNYEIIIVDNGSDEIECLNYLEELKTQGTVSVLQDMQPFNFASLMNNAVKQSKGSVLMFLNNDTELISRDGLSDMLAWCQQPEVGAVGCQLLFSNGRIQHAGAVIGIKSEVHHAFFEAKRDTEIAQGRIDKIAEYAAVTAAAMMVEKSKFESVGGFDETLAVNYNDIDFCLKLRERGLANVYLPFVKFYHHESISRGNPFGTYEKRKRYESEYKLFSSRWGSYLRRDPMYNVNLNQQAATFELPE